MEQAEFFDLFFLKSGTVKKELDKEALKADFAQLWSEPVANLVEGDGEEFDASVMYQF